MSAAEGSWLRAERSLIIDAPPAACLAVLLDVERHPEWQAHLQRVTVIERDDRDRPARAILEGRVGERDLTLAVTYRYPSANRVALELSGSDFGDLRGQWSFRAVSGGRSRAQLVLEARPSWALRLLMRGPAYENIRDQVLGHLLDDFAARLNPRRPGEPPSSRR